MRLAARWGFRMRLHPDPIRSQNRLLMLAQDSRATRRLR